MEVNEEVFSYAYNKGITTVLNPAPADTPTDKLLNNTTWFIPNEIEFEEIYGEPFNESNFLSYSKEISPNLVVTLGEKGCAYIDGDQVRMLDTISVKAVDTTGAGDAFVGAFSYALSMKMSTEDSLKLGLEKATNSVTKKGTQSSYRD